MSRSFRVSLFCFQLYLYESIAQPRKQGKGCAFAGEVFQPGESYGELFEIPRCGNWFDFPCFCNLDFDPPIDCPYCGILTQNGGFVCARENDRLSIVNKEGISQDCDCLRRIPDNLGENYLEAICRDDVETYSPTDPPTISTPNPTVRTDPPTTQPTVPVNNSGGDSNPTSAPITPAPTTPAPVMPAPTTQAPITPPPSTSPDVCVIDVDGVSQTFLNGQSFGSALLTRCIDAVEYPCFCDTSLDIKIRCPYCGYSTVSGELACARLDETIQFNDQFNAPIECTCIDDISLASSCRDLLDPTPRPTQFIPITPQPSQSPTRPTIGAPSIAPKPMTPWPTLGIDKPAIAEPIRQPISQPSSPKPSPDGCFFNRKYDESVAFVENGFPFGDDVVGPCPAAKFPVVCNTRLTGKREYPYCVFSSINHTSELSIQGRSGGSTEKVCAASGSRVLITRSDGNRELCSCLYNNPAIGPVSQCKMVDFNYTEILPTRQPTQPPTIEKLGNNLGVNDPQNNLPISAARIPMQWTLAILGCTSVILQMVTDLHI